MSVPSTRTSAFCCAVMQLLRTCDTVCQHAVCVRFCLQDVGDSYSKDELLADYPTMVTIN